MKTYTNTSDNWGGHTGGLTLADYLKQAEFFEIDAERITADDAAVYCDGEIIGVAE